MKRELFTKLLKNLGEQKVKEEYKYIGEGQPMSNILIIGKEASIKIDEIENREQYHKGIVENFNNWKILEKSNYSKDLGWFNPLSPYKINGEYQVLKIDNGKNHGTSRTWLNYQKLYNKICNCEDNKYVDFHKNIFITEVNSTPSRKTSKADKSSIPFRKENILKSSFIQEFPIVIISGVGYFEINDNKNEIEDIFNVKFVEKKYANQEKLSQPYWIHWNKDRTKLLINTYQLSMGISDLLLENIASEIINSGINKNCKDSIDFENLDVVDN